MLVGALAVPTGIFAQQTAADSLLHRDFRFIKGSDAWLTDYNAAALTRYHRRNISMAEVYGTYQKGGFVNYDGSRNITEFGARVESFYRLTPSLVTYGKMSYGIYSGHDMTGSAFISTERKPFDIVEDSLTNPGKKHRDTYNLTGAIGWDFWRGISLGARVDFTAANMAKYKDLRHKTKYMNLVATAGVYVPIGKRFAIGGDYSYRRNTESVSFSTYGRTEITYKSYINYGPWTGQVEQFDNGGFTDKSRELPMLSEYHAGGLQFSWDILPNFSWFNAFTFAYRSGYYGRKSPYTIVYSNHHSHIYEYHSRLSLKLKGQTHDLDFNINDENLENSMTTYRTTINEAGATYYQYFDPVKSANKLWTNIQVSYTGNFGVNYEQPTWTVQAGADIRRRKQTGYDYPYFRRQNLKSVEGFVRAERNIDLRKGILSLRAGYAFKKGTGEPYEDGTFIEPSDKQDGFPTMEAFLYREYYYLTAPQYTIDGGARYSFVFPGTRMKTYADFAVSHKKANVHDEWLKGRDHLTFTLTLGCTF